jgi:hypothetical protein
MAGIGSLPLRHTTEREGSLEGNSDGVCFGFAQAVKLMALPVPATMGTATSGNSQPTGGDKAAITGDFERSRRRSVS